MSKHPHAPASPGVYRITHVENLRNYTGQSVNIRGHWAHHRYLLKFKKHYNPPLMASWSKYGADLFRFEVLELCDVPRSEPDALREALYQLEKKHMEMIPISMRFNVGPAGYSPTIGLTQSEAQKLKHSRSKGGRPFYATNEHDADDVTLYEHVGELPEHFHRGHVYDVLHGRRWAHRGFTFDFDPDFDVVITSKAGTDKSGGRPRGGDDRSRVVIATDPTTGIETIFDYIGAVQYAGFNTSAVYKCLAGEMTNHAGRTWRFEGGHIHVPKARGVTTHLQGPRTAHGGSREVIGTPKAGGSPVHFTHIKAAADAVGCAPQNISACLRKEKLGIHHSIGGHYWTYADTNINTDTANANTTDKP
jgi:hypothetical protein